MNAFATGYSILQKKVDAVLHGIPQCEHPEILSTNFVSDTLRINLLIHFWSELVQRSGINQNNELLLLIGTIEINKKWFLHSRLKQSRIADF